MGALAPTVHCPYIRPVARATRELGCAHLYTIAEPFRLLECVPRSWGQTSDLTLPTACAVNRRGQGWMGPARGSFRLTLELLEGATAAANLA